MTYEEPKEMGESDLVQEVLRLREWLAQIASDACMVHITGAEAVVRATRENAEKALRGESL